MDNNIYNVVNQMLDSKNVPKVIKKLILSYARPIHPVAKIYKESLFYILYINYEFQPIRLLEPIIDDNYFTIVGLLDSLDFLPKGITKNKNNSKKKWKIYV